MLNIEDFADKNELFDGHYALIRPLSVDGATADVWLALDTNTISNEMDISEVVRMDVDEIKKLGAVFVAIKIYRPQNALDVEGEKRFRDEFAIVYNCRHTNLIHPTYFAIFKDTPYLVLPYCELGSSELLVGSLTEEDKIWKYIFDVSSGLACLHSKNPPIVHQDIKPANILLDDSMNYAITDFGISSERGGAHGYGYDEGNSGTIAYMSPERFVPGADPMPQSDIWAFGATLCELLTGKVPFGEDGGQVQHSNENVPMPDLSGFSQDIQHLIYACLAKEPGDRPSAQQLVEAARARQYPVRKRPVKLIYGLMIILFGLLLSALAYYYVKTEPHSQTNETPIDMRYNIALRHLNSSDANSVKLGILEMDSLSNLNFIPAIYQMGFTYGWYSDSVSVKRKKLLGIDVYDNFMPIDDSYSNMAVALFTRIMELNDSTYASINANAIYRLACYYVVENRIYQQNYIKGKDFFQKAKDWAIKARDKDLLVKINNGLSRIDNTVK